MKKLLFVLAFVFIGQQVFSQQGMYIVTLSMSGVSHPSACSYDNDELCLTITPPPPAAYCSLK